MKFLLELSKVLTTALLFIFILNWTDLTHIGNLRIAVISLLGVMFLMALNFYMYNITKKNQKQIEKIVRKVAIKNKK